METTYNILKEIPENLELKIFPSNFGTKLPNRITKQAAIKGDSRAVIDKTLNEFRFQTLRQ